MEVMIFDGTVNSKKPIKETPNKRNKTKNIKFGIQEVAISFADCGPINNERNIPRNVKIKIIESPNTTASK